MGATNRAEEKKRKKQEDVHLKHQQRQDAHMQMLLKVVAAGGPGQLHLDNYFDDNPNSNNNNSDNKSKQSKHIRGVPTQSVGKGMGVDAVKTASSTIAQPNAPNTGRRGSGTFSGMARASS